MVDHLTSGRLRKLKGGLREMPDRDVKTIPPTTTFEGRRDLIYYFGGDGDGEKAKGFLIYDFRLMIE
jgi:hypothetical protein